MYNESEGTPSAGGRFVPEIFTLNQMTKAILRNRQEPWDKGYGPFSQFIFYRTYSRDGERWSDVITRIIEGTFSIRKSHYLTNGLDWDEDAMQRLAAQMATSAFDGEWGPPGRGYWAQGVPKLIYEKGGMALNNCGYTDVKDLGFDMHWIMDALMMGVGVGFSTYNEVLYDLKQPIKNEFFMTVENELDDYLPPEDGIYTRAYHQTQNIAPGEANILFVVPDSREGWCDATKLLIDSYKGGNEVRFDYSRVRPRGTKIEGFGGEASGPWPLKKLHKQLRVILDSASKNPDRWTNSRLITDMVNMIGCCIVAGNVRRSATIALGHPDDESFAELKHYADYMDNGEVVRQPNWYRRRFGWMSNNSYVLSERDHFSKMIPVIAEGVKRNGEPGFYNLKAVKAFGRLGETVGSTLSNGTVLRLDMATGINPCGEVPLESYELCCLAEWYPTLCLSNGKIDADKAIRASGYAAFYTQTVQLLPTHRPETNEVIARNRRTGISLAGSAALRESVTLTEAINLMEKGYEKIRETNKKWSNDAGVPEAIRVTAEKPSGTTALMMGVPAGAHWPTGKYIRRAVRVDNNKMNLRSVLEAANVPHEPDQVSANTEVYYFPVKMQTDVRPAHEVSMWEQADFASTLAQHFVDNAVSVTVTFDPLTRKEKAESSRVLMKLLLREPDNQEILDAYVNLQKRIPEGDDVERLLASYAGKLKSMSMLPRSGHGYAQAPETMITEMQYNEEVARLSEFDWSSFHDSGIEEVFCSVCAVV